MLVLTRASYLRYTLQLHKYMKSPKQRSSPNTSKSRSKQDQLAKSVGTKAKLNTAKVIHAKQQAEPISPLPKSPRNASDLVDVEYAKRLGFLAIVLVVGYVAYRWCSPFGLSGVWW